MLDRTTLEKLIDECGLTDLKGAILDLALPSIRLYSEPVQDESQIPIGASKLGGQPDLPVGVEYPEYKGKAFGFVAQIDLKEIAKLDLSTYLPPSGLLQFYYSIDFTPEARTMDDVYHWAVFFHNIEPVNLRRTPIPDSNPHARFNPCKISQNIELTIPPHDSYAGRNSLGVGYGSQSPFADGYMSLIGKIWKLEPRRIFNRMFGYPDGIQEDVFSVADTKSHLHVTDDSTVQDWVLLLQADSDDCAEMMWGDVGMLYYCIRRGDLIARRFDKITCIVQGN